MTSSRTTSWILFSALMLVSVSPAIAQGCASGSGSSIISSAQSIVSQVYTGAKSTIYVVAALAIIFMAILAFFGRFQWSKFFTICGGVFLVAVADQLLEFLGGTAASTGITSSGSTCV